MNSFQQKRELTWAIACALGNAMWGACKPDRIVHFKNAAYGDSKTSRFI